MSLRAIPNLTVFRPADAQETAAALGCAEGTVKANGYHAIRRLRRILREMESPAQELESDDTSAL